MRHSQNFDFPGLKNLPPGQFWEFQLTQISSNFKTSCGNLQIRSLRVKLCVAFLLFYFWKSYDVLKSNSPWILLNKYIKFNKNETESKMENPTLKQEGIFFYRLFCPGGLFQDLCFISVYSVLSTLSKYTYFYISKSITSYTPAACFQNRQKHSAYPYLIEKLNSPFNYFVLIFILLKKFYL